MTFLRFQKQQQIQTFNIQMQQEQQVSQVQQQQPPKQQVQLQQQLNNVEQELLELKKQKMMLEQQKEMEQQKLLELEKFKQQQMQEQQQMQQTQQQQHQEVILKQENVAKSESARSSQLSVDEVMYEAVAQVSSSNTATVVSSTSHVASGSQQQVSGLPPVQPHPSKVEAALRMIPRLEDKYDIASGLGMN